MSDQAQLDGRHPAAAYAETERWKALTLGQKQRVFARKVAELILQAYRMGYEVTLAEAYRSPETAKAMAKAGKGIENSLHADRLAIDLNLFKDGVWLTDTADHKPLGAWWEAQHAMCRWGGRFSMGDGNHYSMSHEGRA